MADKSIGFVILAKDLASGDLNKIGESAKKAHEQLGKLGDNKAHLALAAGLAGAAAGAVAFAKSSISSFQDVAKETITLQRAFGGTAESTSRLRFEAEETGVSADSLGRGLKALSTHLANNDKAAKSLGISYRDAHGNIKPFDQLIPEIADKFSHLPNGPEKAALAVKLFGRAGLDMIPMLSRGKVGLEELGKESDKFGLTMSGKSLQAVKQNVINQRELTAAWTGAKVQLGQSLMPVVTQFTTLLATKVIPALTGTLDFVKKNKSWLEPLALVIGSVVVAVKAWNVVQAILNSELLANPIGLVIVAIAGLAAGIIYAYKHVKVFHDAVNSAFTFIKNNWPLLVQIIGLPVEPLIQLALHFNTFKRIAIEGIQAVLHAFIDMAGGIIHGAAAAFGWVPGLGGKLKKARSEFDDFARGALAALNSLDGTHTVSVNVRTAIADQANAYSLPNKASQYASGGLVRGPGGPRSDSILARLSNGEAVIPAHLVPEIAPWAAMHGIPGFAGGILLNTNAGTAASPLGAQLRQHVAAAIDHAFANLGFAGGGGGAGVQQWSGLVAQVLGLLGLSPLLLGKVLTQMQTESGGNPNIIQGVHDINWPNNLARGLMQTTPGTFASYAGPFRGLGIFNPLANVYAALNYAMHTYGPNLSGLGLGHGYDSGGWLPPGVSLVHNNTGKPEPVLTNEQWQHMRGGNSYIISVGGVHADQHSRRRLVQDIATEISRIQGNGGGLARNFG